MQGVAKLENAIRTRLLWNRPRPARLSFAACGKYFQDVFVRID